jgi:hypothetical protein
MAEPLTSEQLGRALIDFIVKDRILMIQTRGDQLTIRLGYGNGPEQLGEYAKELLGIE